MITLLILLVLGSPFEYVDYAASKGAIDTLTTGLSLEVAKDNIRVNCVRPGFIDTTMHVVYVQDLLIRLCTLTVEKKIVSNVLNI